ncbi:hypothetical protein MPER_00665 [Moniliophthora perniciosa FA553]|nr:hypothetical protein MPER_00665 [Moniliophthora perniciosa FA553]
MHVFHDAPLAPALAVDMRVLEFVSKLFLRVPPNHTAWCETLQDFLESSGYQLHGKDPLRRRFANALQWYGTMKNAVETHVKNTLALAREGILQPHSKLDPHMTPSDYVSTGDGAGDDSIPDYCASKRRRLNTPTPAVDRPSEYLRSRCPLCFGGDSHMLKRQWGQDRFESTHIDNLYITLELMLLSE